MEEKDIKIIEEYVLTYDDELEIDHIADKNEFNAIKKLLQAYKQDEKMIIEMAKYIENIIEDDICNKKNCYADKYENGHCKKCINCIIDYFRKKCEE